MSKVKLPRDSLCIPRALFLSGPNRNSLECLWSGFCSQYFAQSSLHIALIASFLWPHGVAILAWIIGFSAPSLAHISASSFPGVPMWAFTQHNLIRTLRLARVLRMSIVLYTVLDFICRESRDLRAACESQRILTYLMSVFSDRVSRNFVLWKMASISAWKTVVWGGRLMLSVCILSFLWYVTYPAPVPLSVLLPSV